jgi:hypothetical protein
MSKGQGKGELTLPCLPAYPPPTTLSVILNKEPPKRRWGREEAFQQPFPFLNSLVIFNSVTIKKKIDFRL